MPRASSVSPSRPDHARALVESPLQLLSAVEAHVAGLGGTTTRVHVRTDVPALDDARQAMERLGLPPGIRVEMRGREGALGWREPVELVGDPFSGLHQMASAPATAPVLSRLRRLDNLVLLDDGLATLELAEILTDPEAPLVRIGQRSGRVRRTLGALAAGRLRELARGGRLTLFTAMPLDPATASALAGLGVRIVPNTFAWLADVDPPDTPAEPTIVVGSGMIADGLVDPDAYVGWLTGLAADGPLRYIPHRRQEAAVLAALAATPGVTVDAPGAPVELRLQGLRAGQRIVGLPSTSSVLLTRILTPRGVSVEPFDVPEEWWSAGVSVRLRSHLRRVIALAEEARARSTGSH